MTLKDKFRSMFKNHFQKGKEEQLLLELVDDDLEQVADDYAIEFAEWKDTNQIDYLKLNYKELLEIFKKEKGL